MAALSKHREGPEKTDSTHLTPRVPSFSFRRSRRKSRQPFLYRLGLSGHGIATQATFRMG